VRGCEQDGADHPPHLFLGASDVSTYAVGDLQGCFASLQALLTKVAFNSAQDRLWLVGDLVNRGPNSLECLRFVRSLGQRAIVVLGNHDLHLLAVAAGISKIGRRDTIGPILDAPDCDELLDWLRQQKLLHVDGNFLMVHAGLLPQWSLTQALRLAGEVESLLRGASHRAFLQSMYGNEPNVWDDNLIGNARHRLVTNAMTRMRVLGNNNELDLEFKGELASLPPGLVPWFTKRHPSFADKTILAGHWSALGLYETPNFIGLDSGCAWGRQLTALRLEDRTVFQVPCAETTAREDGE
jgi:bis(5'-nucleosyl)-tetraphosphatase (symmetrical)